MRGSPSSLKAIALFIGRASSPSRSLSAAALSAGLNSRSRSLENRQQTQRSAPGGTHTNRSPYRPPRHKSGTRTARFVTPELEP